MRLLVAATERTAAACTVHTRNLARWRPAVIGSVAKHGTSTWGVQVDFFRPVLSLPSRAPECLGLRGTVSRVAVFLIFWVRRQVNKESIELVFMHATVRLGAPRGASVCCCSVRTDGKSLVA